MKSYTDGPDTCTDLCSDPFHLCSTTATMLLWLSTEFRPVLWHSMPKILVCWCCVTNFGLVLFTYFQRQTKILSRAFRETVYQYVTSWKAALDSDHTDSVQVVANSRFAGSLEVQCPRVISRSQHPILKSNHEWGLRCKLRCNQPGGQFPVGSVF